MGRRSINMPKRLACNRKAGIFGIERSQAYAKDGSSTEGGGYRQQRLLPGHWEGDLIKGASNRSCVGTLVERTTRFVILCKMDGGTAEAALEGFSRQLKKLPESMRTSLTYDRGTELTCYP